MIRRRAKIKIPSKATVTDVPTYDDICRQAVHNKSERLNLQARKTEAERGEVEPSFQLMKHIKNSEEFLERERDYLVRKEQRIKHHNINCTLFII